MKFLQNLQTISEETMLCKWNSGQCQLEENMRRYKYYSFAFNHVYISLYCPLNLTVVLTIDQQ